MQEQNKIEEQNSKETKEKEKIERNVIELQKNKGREETRAQNLQK